MIAAVAHPLFVLKVYFTKEVKIARHALPRLFFLITTFGVVLPLGVINTLEASNLYIIQHIFFPTLRLLIMITYQRKYHKRLPHITIIKTPSHNDNNLPEKYHKKDFSPLENNRLPA